MTRHSKKRAYRLRLMAWLCVMTLCAGMLSFAPSVQADADREIFHEGFDTGAFPAGWTQVDADGDGYTWTASDNTYTGYSGKCIYSTSALSWSQSLTPDDWLISPAITLPSSQEAGSCKLTYQRQTSFMSGYRDHCGVYVSTQPITSAADVTKAQKVFDDTYYTGSGYEQQTVDLSDFRGQTIYVAFRHCDASGVWQMYLDEVSVIAAVPRTVRVNLPAATEVYEAVPVDGSQTVKEGTNYSFRLNFAPDYSAEHALLTVTANDKELTPVDGVYTIEKVTQTQKVSVSFAYQKGDVNGSGRVDTRDAQLAYRGVSGRITLNAVQQEAIDLDDNGAGMIDALALYRFASGRRDYLNINEDVSLIWKSTYADAANGFADDASVTGATYYLNNKKVTDFSKPINGGDAKEIFFNDQDKARVVNLADGYAMTVSSASFKPDYSLSALRTKYTADSFVLTVSKENQNPYGNTASGWNIYLTEWLNRYVADDEFLSANNIQRTRTVVESTTILPGYTVLNYDMAIQNAGDIALPYYNIAVIRKNNEYVNFYLLVMKSAANGEAAMDSIVKSFKEFTATGTAKNVQEPYACDIPDQWSDETKAYYQKLLDQKTVDWGFFSASMVDNTDSGFDRQAQRIESEYDRISTAIDYDYEIMPTYTHIAWGDHTNYFPSEQAAQYAGGNGFNGKPVLQFTYQFTTLNNTNLNGYTPMFDIMRGTYDKQFRRLAQDIKAYGKPVLFRLNNEMNTDWTSYAGIVTLLDPDIYIATWERLYDIFAEEGVDNCIWIFNPIAKTTPYCNWGEYLNFVPDIDYVQILGLTSYEMGNGSRLTSFKSLYTTLYEKNSPYFDNYPWVISEFGAGAGGEQQYNYDTKAWSATKLGRNAAQQTQWINEMFDCLEKSNQSGYEFCKNIKGAVWFSVNDYATVNGTDCITNYFNLDSGVPNALTAFKNGLKATQ